MSRPILIDPRGGPVTVAGQMIEPSDAPLKIDMWRHVRHPPPDLVHAFSIKAARSGGDHFDAGHPATLLGKVISWVWLCSEMKGAGGQWRVRVDVRQEGRSVHDYPAEYWGPLPEGQPLAQLKISEVIQELRRS